MYKIVIIVIVPLLIVSFVLLSGCTSTLTSSQSGSFTPTTTVISTNHIGGWYNASIQTVVMSTANGNVTGQNIVYTKDNQTFSGDFIDYTSTAYDYIIKNTPQNATFLCWWDYGDGIIGFTGRNSVVRRPSLSIADTVSNIVFAKTSAEKQQLIQKLIQDGAASNETIADIASALLSSDPSQTISIMNKYDAQYLFVAKEDSQKAFAMFHALNKQPSDTSGLIVGKAAKGASIDGFSNVYSGGGVSIYKITT